MPIAYTIDPVRSIVLSRAWGVVTDRDLLAHVRALAADPRFKPHFNQLYDCRGVTDVEVSSSGIKDLAKLNPFGVGARRAVVVNRDITYGMARMYQMTREPSTDELEVFRDWDSALEWLGIAHEKAEVLSALFKAPPIPGLD